MVLDNGVFMENLKNENSFPLQTVLCFLQEAVNTGVNMLFFHRGLMIFAHDNTFTRIWNAKYTSTRSDILKHVANNVNPGFLMSN